MFVQTHFQRAHRNQHHHHSSSNNQHQHSFSLSHGHGPAQTHSVSQQAAGQRSPLQPRRRPPTRKIVSSSGPTRDSTGWRAEFGQQASCPSPPAGKLLERQTAVGVAGASASSVGKWACTPVPRPPPSAQRVHQHHQRHHQPDQREASSNQQFEAGARVDRVAHAEVAARGSPWSSRIADLVRRLAERAGSHGSLSERSKRNLELVAAFCVGFVSYQLETWRLLAVDATLAPGECPHAAAASTSLVRPRAHWDLQHPSEVARRARLIHSQSVGRSQPARSRRPPLRHQFSLEDDSILPDVPTLMHPPSPLSFSLDLEQQEHQQAHSTHQHGTIVCTPEFEPTDSLRKPIPPPRSFTAAARAGSPAQVSPLGSVRPFSYPAHDEVTPADEPDRSRSVLSGRSSEQAKCKSPNPSKKSSSSKLSFAGELSTTASGSLCYHCLCRR